MIRGREAGCYRQQADFNETNPENAGYIQNNPIENGRFSNGLFLVEGVDYGNQLPDYLPDGKVFCIPVEVAE